jgi:formylglycine-generating enzyme
MPAHRFARTWTRWRFHQIAARGGQIANMVNLDYKFELGTSAHSLNLVLVEGTRGSSYEFGEGNQPLGVTVQDFFISTVPVTQALWTHVMSDNPAVVRGGNRPVENVSWDMITGRQGFLERINAGDVLLAMSRQVPSQREVRFRLPSETEWEYAARGGPYWTQRYQFSGGNEIDSVAWYKDNSGDSTHDVAQKAPNQLGIYDMSGNVWEWCQDAFTREINRIPTDGRALPSDGPDRVLRGGCFHNWAIHCTVSKRYEIGHQYHDGCIGFRLVLAEV